MRRNTFSACHQASCFIVSPDKQKAARPFSASRKRRNNTPLHRLRIRLTTSSHNESATGYGERASLWNCQDHQARRLRTLLLACWQVGPEICSSNSIFSSLSRITTAFKLCLACPAGPKAWFVYANDLGKLYLVALHTPPVPYILIRLWLPMSRRVLRYNHPALLGAVSDNHSLLITV